MTTLSRQKNNGLYLINSTLGWMFSGRIKGHDDVDESLMSMLVTVNNDDVDKFWELEIIGISDVTKENEDEELITNFKNTSRNDARYQVTWPWKVSKYEIADKIEIINNHIK